MDTFRAESGVPGPGSSAECGGEADAKEGISCPLDCHESLVALQMVNWVGGAIVRLHVRHLEPTRDRLIEDESGERLGGPKVDVVRRLLAIHLELSESTVDFFKPMFVVVGPSVRFVPTTVLFRMVAANSSGLTSLNILVSCIYSTM